MTQEPPSELIRRSDVLAWQPKLSPYQLQLWETLGIIRVFQPTPNSRRLYYTSDIKKILNQNGNGHANL